MERRISLQIRIMLSYYFLVVEIYELTYNIFMLIKNKYTFFKASKGFLSVKNSKASMNARRKYGARTNKNTGIPVFFTEVKALF